jgi:hypothetical protein
MDMVRLYLPDFHLPLEAERLCRLKTTAGASGDDDEGDHMKKRGDDLNKYLTADSKHKRPFGKPVWGILTHEIIADLTLSILIGKVWYG